MLSCRRVIAAAVVALGAAAVAAAQPQVGNARVTTQPAGSLQQTFRSAVAAQADVRWIGYTVPVVDGERVMCCYGSGTRWINDTVRSSGSDCCATCGLEPENQSITRAPAPPAGPVKLEGSGQMIVLFRVSGKEVERIRVFSEECALDAGGREVVWLTGVRPADSVALLESLVSMQEDRSNRAGDGAISAIALHGDPAADAALERLLAPAQPQHVRAKIPFWLGNSRGRRGFELLQRVLRSDPSPDVRKKAVFGLSQSKEPNTVSTLIDTARGHEDAAVRGEAVFWLAQKAGSRAAAAITERIEQDPETEVKKRAVFALSQLPKDEGVPLLIKVARTNTNPVVRKQAMFWLGQSKDARAIEFFAEVLR